MNIFFTSQGVFVHFFTSQDEIHKKQKETKKDFSFCKQLFALLVS